MKSLLALCLAALPVAALAQAPTPVDTKNPVVWSANDMYQKEAKFIIAAAEEMPADKLGFKPTADQWTYGKIISHIVLANTHVCAMLNDTKAPTTMAVAETASKADLVSTLKASFDFCNTAFAAVTDDKLGDTITFFGGRKVPRARALLEEVGDLDDHYSQMASYLRLNGLTPPSAQKK
jgi:uncharacterized damage-inducible protein DinB